MPERASAVKTLTLATKAGNTDVVYHAGADFHANAGTKRAA